MYQNVIIKFVKTTGVNIHAHTHTYILKMHHFWSIAISQKMNIRGGAIYRRKTMLNRRMSLRYEKFSRSLILDVKANSLRRRSQSLALPHFEANYNKQKFLAFIQTQKQQMYTYSQQSVNFFQFYFTQSEKNNISKLHL